MTPLRFGVVGTGHWAAAAHLSGLLATPGAALVGVWGRDPDKAAALAARFGATAFGRFDALLRAVDAVTFAVPPQVQPELAAAAAAAGKHLILEKPIATTAAAAQGLADAVARAGVASLVFFTRRFQPEIAAAIEAARGERWTAAEVRVHSAALVTASPYAGSAWRQADGAALWDIGPHALSVLLPLLGEVVSARLVPAPDRVVGLQTTHAGGGRADLSLTLHSPPEEASNAYRLRAPGRALLLPDPRFERSAAFAVAARRLIDMVAGGRPTDACDVRLGARVVEILADAERSAPRESR